MQVIDSHTGGEPTRVIVADGPDLGSGSLAERRELFATQFDDLRCGVVCEPRGSDVVVGATLVEPTDPECIAGVIFFNNVGVLGMCGHGAIGVMVTLAHLGRIQPGVHKLETPVGVVTATLHDKHRVTLENVPSYRLLKDVSVTPEHEEGRTYVGDVAWGGNWFFLVKEHGESLTLENVERLHQLSTRIKRSLAEQGITGTGGAEIDHVELFGDPLGEADSKNFVLCPGNAYDRSPCGTGTSAKLACLVSDGVVQPGATYRQESICGSVFEAVGQLEGETVRVRITGSAWVTAETTLLFSESDPFRYGIRS